ncbi:Fc receptor-like protein 5 [Engraulis encrasicolus]|uniref:Fc receptor-like protein 5 n=1 Tax=Engraulis encrasicolus TaxID=184585 RepID=UPI002FD26381
MVRFTSNQSGKPTPSISCDTASPVLTGNTVTLTCDMGQSTGWSFYWYKDTQSSTPVAQTGGNSYRISSAKVSDGGQYWCRAGRGDPVYDTHYSNEILVTIRESPKAVVTPLTNWTDVFHGENFVLRCDIPDADNEWKYTWYVNKLVLKGDASSPVYSIIQADQTHSGNYSCRGTHSRDSQTSEISGDIRVSVSEKATSVLRGPAQPWLAEGDSVTLSCEVSGSSAGWTFHWYKTAPYRPGLKYVSHENTPNYVELLPDSSRGAGGSYTLSPAALRHTGVYVCRAERGEPAYQTEFSQWQPLWVTGHPRLPLPVVFPNKTQHFWSKSLSLSCEGILESFGWKLRWFPGSMGRERCPSLWTESGSTCSTSYTSSSDCGVYWCQSESGEQSNPVNITVHSTRNAILESPVHPVAKGDPLTLRCRYHRQPLDISADFYKDGTLLHTSSTGELTIPAVSKSHEGLYKCRNPEKGESPVSWIAVKGNVKKAQGNIFKKIIIL